MSILFDLDGTLLDTSHDFNYAINKVLEARKAPKADYDAVRDAISFGSKRIIAAAFKLDHVSNAEHKKYLEELLPVFIEHYAQTGFRQTRAFPGIEELLINLENAGIKWGIVTNKHKALTDPLLQHIGYFARSACVICGDASSKPKPAPDHLLLAAKLLETAPEKCIYIGDALTDVQAGKAAGMRTIAAAFGFVPKNVQVMDWQADAIAQTPHDIWPWINKWLNNTK